MISSKKITLVGVVLVCLAGLPFWRWWNAPGVWEGTMGSGVENFRVAFELGGNGQGVYHNIDDGIHEPLPRLSRGWNSFKGTTPGGGSFVLNYDWLGRSLTGTFCQGPGTDGQLSLVAVEKTYPVTLMRGQDYLEPRLETDGQRQTSYSYRPPPLLTDGWETGDLNRTQTNISGIEGIVGKILHSDYPSVHSLLVVKDGRLVLDEYFYGYGPQDSHPAQSITKDVFSLLFGIAGGQGLCGPNQKLYDFFPSYRTGSGWDARKDRITLATLLTMTSGLGCNDFKDSKDCSWAMVQSPDWLDFSLSLPLSAPPGSRFAYCGACLIPLGAVVEKQSGMALPAFAQKYLFDPLGIQTPTWWEGPRGIHSPAFGLSLKPRDMAKLGLLVLQKGKWNGKQIVPEKWITEATSPHVLEAKTGNKADYGYLWWQRNVQQGKKKWRVFDAWGVGGQHIFIVPELNVVCVLTGGNYKDGGLAKNSFKIFQEVLGALD